MTTLPTQTMLQSIINDAIPAKEIAYYNRRLQNLVFQAVITAFSNEVKAGRITRSALAKRTGASRSQITRWFAHPSNWTLDTISTLLIGMGAELESKVIFLQDRAAEYDISPVFEQLSATGNIENVNIANIAVRDYPHEAIELSEIPFMGSSDTREIVSARISVN